MRAQDVVRSFVGVREPAPSGISVGLDLDILDASVALRVLLVVKYCSLSLSVISFGASSIFSLLQRNCSCLPKDLGKACAHSFCVTSASRERMAILPRRLLAS